MSQKFIDFGTFPDDPDADAIRTAFQKIQDNFTEVYAGITGTSVTSINRTPGAGVTVNSPSGEVIISANISNIQMFTNTLKMGIENNTSMAATLIRSSQTIWVDLPDVLHTQGLALTGDASISGVTTLGGNLNTSASINANAAGAGIYAINNGTISANNLIGTLTAASNAQPNVTSLGTLTSLGVSGTVTAPNFTANTGIFAGNGSGLSALVGGNVTGYVANSTHANVADVANAVPAASLTGTTLSSNVTGSSLTSVGTLTNLVIATAGNITGANNITANTTVGTVSGKFLTGTLTTNAQPNITSVGTLDTLAIATAGNITGANNITANTTVGTVSGKFLTGTLTTNAQPNITSTGTLDNLVIAVAGNITGANNISANTTVGTVSGKFLTGTLTTNAQPNVTSVGTLGALAVTGNISAGNMSATLFTGALNGVITASASSQPNVTTVGTLTALTVGNATANTIFGNGTITATGNIAAGNVNAGNLLTVNFLTGILTTNAQPNITSTGTLTGLTIATGGNITGANVISATTFTGALNGVITASASSQPNVTTVGTLTGLTVGGNLSSQNANLGNIVNANVYNGVTSNLSGQFISTLVTGTAPLAIASTTVVANLNADMVDGLHIATAATANTVVARDTNASFSANVITANLTGNATTAGTVITAAQPNITSVGTLTSLSTGTGNITTGNVIAGNLLSANYVTGILTTAAQPNITSVGTLTGLSMGTANITAGNVTATMFTGALTGLASSATVAASANSVAGANVSGQVANANVAYYDNVTLATTGVYYPQFGNATSGNLAAYANANYSANLANGSFAATTFVGALSGLASSATVAASANAVAGANVSGQVNFAATANAVAGGNVTGTVTSANVAFYDSVTLASSGTYYTQFVNGTTGNLASYANTLYSANIANGSFAATTFVGALSGLASSATVAALANSVLGSNVTGPVSSATTANNLALGSSGSLPYQSAANTTAMLAKGTDGQVLKLSGGVPTWGTDNDTAGNGTLTVSNATALSNVSVFLSMSNVYGANSTIGTVMSANVGPSLSNLATAMGNATTGFIKKTAADTYSFDGSTYLTSGTATLAVVTAAGNTTSNIVSFTNAAASNATSNGAVVITGGLGVGGNVYAGAFYGTGTGLSTLTGANVSGTVANATYAISSGSTGTAGTVTTNAQPNITSTGTLANLTVRGPTDLGSVANLKITGTAVAGQTLVNDGTGNLVWGFLIEPAVAGPNLAVQYKTAGGTILAGSSNFLFNDVTNVLTLLGNISGTNVITANSFVGNITGNVSATTISGTLSTAAQTNITSLGLLSALSVNGTVATKDISTNGNIGLTGNISLTSGSITSTGNISVANVTASNNLTGSNSTIGNLIVSTSIALPGAIGTIPYQSATNTTSMLAAGTTSQVLVGGPSGPSWAAISGLVTAPPTIVTVTAATYSPVITTGAMVIRADTSANNINITLPTAVSSTAVFYIKKVAAPNTVTVSTTSAQTIDGGTTAVWTSLYETITLISNNTNWEIL
jgi:hypothetical protein